MNCDQARPLIDPYADGELDAPNVLDVEAHFRECAHCEGVLRNRQSVKRALRNDALYFAAPAELRRRVREECRAQVPAERSFWSWLTAVPAGAVGVCLGVLLTLAITRATTQHDLAGEILSSHVRSLMANHALDVVSSDQHTVKPWFDGKLDFSPPVADFAGRGFPLLGGRVDYVGGRTVAALVYQRHKHVINLFIWPDRQADSKPAAAPALQGYNMVRWSQAGMSYWAISDVNGEELGTFASMFAAP